jgi:hypothetical protein
MNKTFTIVLLGLLACSERKQVENEKPVQHTVRQLEKSGQKEETAYQATLFVKPDSTVGYTIHKAGKIYIRQPVIPGVTGSKGFADKKQARKVANLMLYKIRRNIIPPSITISELDSLGVKY